MNLPKYCDWVLDVHFIAIVKKSTFKGRLEGLWKVRTKKRATEKFGDLTIRTLDFDMVSWNIYIYIQYILRGAVPVRRVFHNHSWLVAWNI